MSGNFQALLWAKSARGISSGAYRLLMCMADRVGKTGFDVWPSHSVMADDTESSVPSVKRYLGELRDRGLISVIPKHRNDGSQTSNIYRLNVHVKIRIPKQEDIEISHEKADEYSLERSHPSEVEIDDTLAQNELPPPINLNSPPRSNLSYHELDSLRTYPIEQRLLASSDAQVGQEELFDGSVPVAAPQETLPDFVVRRWNEIAELHPTMAKCRPLEDGHKRKIQLRGDGSRKDGETAFDVWNEAFAAIERSPFLRGLAPPGPGRDKSFRPSLIWMLTQANFAKVVIGAYDGKLDRDGQSVQGNTRTGPTAKALAGVKARFSSRPIEQQRNGNSSSN